MHKIKKVWHHFMSDSLYRNSIYLILSNAVLAVFGYVFWLINAKLYSAADIGLASALIAAINLIVNLSLVGFNTAVIRMLPQYTNQQTKNGIINGISLIVGGLALFITAIFIGTVHVISPELTFIQSNTFLIMGVAVFGVISALNVLTDNLFVAYRAAGYTLAVNIVLCIVRLIAAFFFIQGQATGLFLAFAIGIAACLVASYAALYRLGYRLSKPDFSQVRTMARFAFGNYLSNLFTILPTMLLPLIVVSGLNATQAGYFFMAFTIAQTLYTIPVAVTTALLAEGSHSPGALRQQLQKTFLVNAALLVPIILIVTFFSGPLLAIFGHQYSLYGQDALRILAFSAIFILINYLFVTLYRLMDRAIELALSQCIGSAVIIGLVLWQLPFGLTGIALGWCGGQALVSLLLLLRFSIMHKQKLRPRYLLSILQGR